MFNVVVRHTQKAPLSAAAKRYLGQLAQTDVLVGIPAAQNVRRGPTTQAKLLAKLEKGVPRHESRDSKALDESGGSPYSEAHQLALHESGSPLWFIPPRPVLKPAVASIKPKLARYFAQAVRDALEGRDPMPTLESAGRAAQTAAFDWFVNPENNWPPNSPVTIYLKGSDRPMIDTGEMRRAIRYVVREK